jgi:hypothetical protein
LPLLDIKLDDVAFLKVCKAFQTDATLKAGTYLAHVLLETLQ